MSKINQYRQCHLSKDNLSTTCYIDAKYATIGRIVGMKQSNDSWDEGWRVDSAGELTEAKLVEEKAHSSGDIWKPSAVLTSRGKK